MPIRLTPIAGLPVCLVLAATLPAARADTPARPATAEEVAALAERLPAVAVPPARGQPSPPPFVLRGSMPSDDHAYDYEIVWTGTDYRAAMLDADDGLPLLVSDANTLYACDVTRGAPWVVIGGRFAMKIVASPRDRGLVTSNLWHTGAEPQLPPTRVDFAEALRKAAAGSTIQQLADGATRLTQVVDSDRTRVVVFEPLPSRNVAFGQVSGKDGAYTSYHELRFDGFDPTDARFAMPPVMDVMKRLGVGPNPPELWQQGFFQRSGQLGKIRRAIRGDAAMRETFGDPPGGWDALKAQDAAVAGRWRTMLGEFGVAFAPPEKPWATTRPTSR